MSDVPIAEPVGIDTKPAKAARLYEGSLLSYAHSYLGRNNNAPMYAREIVDDAIREGYYKPVYMAYSPPSAVLEASLSLHYKRLGDRSIFVPAIKEGHKAWQLRTGDTSEPSEATKVAA